METKWHGFPLEVSLKAGGGHGRRCWDGIEDSIKYQAGSKDSLWEIQCGRGIMSNHFFVSNPKL